MMLAQDRKDHRATYGYDERYNLNHTKCTALTMAHQLFSCPAYYINRTFVALVLRRTLPSGGSGSNVKSTSSMKILWYIVAVQTEQIFENNDCTAYNDEVERIIGRRMGMTSATLASSNLSTDGFT